MLQKRMKELRLQAKLTKKEVAEKLGISTSLYGQWETGKRNPASKNLQKVANLFSVITDYLLGNTDNKNSTKFENDLEESLTIARTFSGKPISEHNREVMREILTEMLKKITCKN